MDGVAGRKTEQTRTEDREEVKKEDPIKNLCLFAIFCSVSASRALPANITKKPP
jgi:hypothetical protein